MMSNSARFIILGSKYGWGLSTSTCSMQMGCGRAGPPRPSPRSCQASLPCSAAAFPATGQCFLLQTKAERWQTAGTAHSSFSLYCVVSFLCVPLDYLAPILQTCDDCYRCCCNVCVNSQHCVAQEGAAWHVSPVQLWHCLLGCVPRVCASPHGVLQQGCAAASSPLLPRLGQLAAVRGKEKEKPFWRQSSSRFYCKARSGGAVRRNFWSSDKSSQRK